MSNIKTIQINGEEKSYPVGTPYRKIAEEYEEQYKDDIVLVLMNNNIRELFKTVTEDGELQLITTADRPGRRAYRRSVTLMMQKAVYNLCDGEGVSVQVLHSISQGYFCRLKGDVVLDAQYLQQLKQEMIRICNEDHRIMKSNVNTQEATRFFHNCGMVDKERLFHYRRSSRVNLYELDGYYDYFYGCMIPSTGYLKYFDLELYQDGFVLLFPNGDTKKPAVFQPSDKLFKTLDEAYVWGEMMGIGTIGALNDAIMQGNGQDIILMQEALMEKKIGSIAEQILEDRSKKFIMIAGPSSSGKTTFSHRLSIQLKAHGLKPHPIPLDDFYKNREEAPLDETGQPDFECLESLDVELFNETMSDLLAGREVEMPEFNFKIGKREYKGKKLQLGEEDVLVIEGIHGLNDKLSYSLPDESKFKIYISALTQLNIDEHNSIPTTDGRLIRRIVRDARTRGTSALETIRMWGSVRRGEEKHIFPFQEEADVMFNSALIYEMAVLKLYADPLLFQIESDCPEYLEAKRLLKFMDYFLPMPFESIASNSIIREFIGGSCFPV